MSETPDSGAEEPFDVFVSHASKDGDVAARVTAQLEAGGLKCWIAPRDVSAAQKYSVAISQGLRGSRVFLLLLSNASNASEAVFNETEMAFRYRRHIAVLRVEDVEPSEQLEFFVNARQRVDGLGSDLVPAVDRLREGLKGLLRREAAPPSEAEPAPPDSTPQPGRRGDRRYPSRPPRWAPPEEMRRAMRMSRRAPPPMSRPPPIPRWVIIVAIVAAAVFGFRFLQGGVDGFMPKPPEPPRRSEPAVPPAAPPAQADTPPY